MADIDNMRGDTLRVVEENTLDNMRGVTQRVISENSIDNTRGVTYRVYNVNGGSAPVIDELNVMPSTSAQVITAPEGTDGYSPVKVSAVTSSIDANIVAGNIKKDVSILGVTGSYEGVAPSGTKQITSNGIHDVAGYANADVQVPISGPQSFMSFNVDNNGLCNGIYSIDLTGIKNFAARLENVLQNTTFYGNTLFTNANQLEEISGSSTFRTLIKNNSYITAVGLNNLLVVSGQQACQGMIGKCLNITRTDLHNLTSITGSYSCANMFGECANLTLTDLDNLTTTSGQYCCQYMFQKTGVITASFPKLEIMTGSQCFNKIFNSCTSLTSVSFPALKSTSFGSNTNQFYEMLLACSNVTVHFPSNLQSVIGSWADVTGGFGGTNTTVLFDLPATE